MDFLAGVLIVCIVTSSLISIGESFNVVDFGAVGDGRRDDSQAFLKAWGALCGAGGNTPTLEIPSGKTFLLQTVKFQGPCRSNKVQIQILGNIVAPGSAQAWRNYNLVDCWICFSDVAGFIMQGSGTINGRAAHLWQENGNGPRAMYLHNCKNFYLSGFTILNSPKEHLSINQCNSGSISNVHINSPGRSPNTDGIEISASTQIHIQDSSIACGDDCIAINGGCSHINISGIACGPGHGISVGSLGDRGGEDTVEEVQVRNCNFTGTENGVRIKTYPQGSGYARSITFEEITVIDSKNPIIIDQNYHERQRNSVDVRGVTFTSVHGTSASEVAITLDCCDSGCSNIVMNDVRITSSNPGKETRAICKNAHGTSHSTKPDVPCLDHI